MQTKAVCISLLRKTVISLPHLVANTKNKSARMVTNNSVHNIIQVVKNRSDECVDFIQFLKPQPFQMSHMFQLKSTFKLKHV